MARIKVSVAGGSGYVGGELLRLLLFHPAVELISVSSERYAGFPPESVHPNLKGLYQARSLRFCSFSDLKKSEVIFLSLPHGKAMEAIEHFRQLAPRLIDLSADFRLQDPGMYREWYGVVHPRPELLDQFVYGIPELHREEMKVASYVSSAGCNATAVILSLYPFYKNNLIDTCRTVSEVKTGTSQAGHRSKEGSHHPVRANSIRAYQPSGHRHIPEIKQELGIPLTVPFHFSATSISQVRGVHAVSHVFLNHSLEEKDIWHLYRGEYSAEPFIRMVKSKKGIYRLPDPKILWGTNFCDLGFARDPLSDRVILYSALDNLIKGAAGQAVQAFNIMNGLEETLGLGFPGLHPI